MGCSVRFKFELTVLKVNYVDGYPSSQSIIRSNMPCGVPEIKTR